MSEANGEQVTDIVFLATAWGPRSGGINAFNIDLCTALAGLARSEQGRALRVACIVPSAPWGNDERLLDGALVIPLGHSPELTELPVAHTAEVIAQLDRHGLAGSVIVGHDLHTGPVALAVRDALRARSIMGSRAAIVVHTDPAAYKGFEGGSDERTQVKVNEQREIVRGADLVFAVGPRLANVARDLLRGLSTHPVELIPGLAPIEPIQEPSMRFHAITFGRLEPRADRVKQGRLALAGFANLVGPRATDLGHDPVFRLVGVEEREASQFATLASEQAGRPIMVYALPFNDDRTHLWKQLSEHSASLMLSLHEGFGLTGWEAVAAGVPLVLSTNTGLYDHLESHDALGRKATGCVYPVTIQGSLNGDFDQRDIELIGAALADVARNPTKAKKGALDLRRMCLDAGFTWASTAYEFAEGCGLRLGNPRGVPTHETDRAPYQHRDSTSEGNDALEEPQTAIEATSLYSRSTATTSQLPMPLIHCLAENYPDVTTARELWRRAGGSAREVENLSRPVDLWQRLWQLSVAGAPVRPVALLRAALEDLPNNEILLTALQEVIS
ncbi:glycosyltransferase [Nannocystaceae bacterium ST9]